jgi:hypothetical protein
MLDALEHDEAVQQLVHALVQSWARNATFWQQPCSRKLHSCDQNWVGQPEHSEPEGRSSQLNPDRSFSAGATRMPSGVTKSRVPVALTCQASAAG